MNILILVSAGGDAMRRSVRTAIADLRPDHDLRMLAPDSEARALRETGVPIESWRPAGLFNVLRSITALRRTVERFAPDAIMAFGWTAAAVSLGALPARYARRTLVSLQDPIRRNEMPKTFVDKRLPELLARAGEIACAYDALRRVIVDVYGVPAERVAVVPYGVAPLLPPRTQRAPNRRGPIVGYAGRLEGDRGWETAVDAISLVIATQPQAQLWLARTGPVASLVRAHARQKGALDAVTFFENLPLAELFSGIDMLAAPQTSDGLPFAVVEALVSGVPVVGANVPGITDTLAPYPGWLVDDDAEGFRVGIEAAWASIDDAWAQSQAGRPEREETFSPQHARDRLNATFARFAALKPGENEVPELELSTRNGEHGV